MKSIVYSTLALAFAISVNAHAQPAPAKQAPSAKPTPTAVQMAVAGGMRLEASFAAPGGMTGWVLSQGVDNNVVVYSPADGSVAIAGNMLDASGKNLTKDHLAKYAPKPDYSKLWSELEKSTWFVEGAKDAGSVKTVLYAFEDPNCSYCHLAWKAFKPYYAAGLQVRWVPVAFLAANSVDKAAEVLAAPDPGAAFTAQQEAWGSKRTYPAASPALKAKIQANTKLMNEWGFKGTPAIVYKDASGAVATLGGMPQLSQLPAITGLPAQANNDPDLQRFR